ncbi:MAG TPA: dihydrofolate reductase [Steroidobacteraceae bacterium]|nr:dihydrofolate reductase [Steroidobacteraceae bacterium]
MVAVAENGVIGRDGQLPWHLPDDLKRFKALTLGKPVLMGRKTYASIGKPLVNRPNIVLTRNRCWEAPQVIVVHSLEDALERARPATDLMVIGGADIFELCLPRCSVIHLTRVHAQVEGDTRFVAPQASDWRETAREEHAADARHAYAFSFLTLERIV